MKKMYKAMLLVLCAVLLVAGSVMGTLAYLKAQTGTVKNTFTVGSVAITLQEYAIDNTTGKKTTDVVDKLENIKLVPGRTIEKNPFITVGDSSEDCYLFVKLDKSTDAKFDDFMTFEVADGWTALDNVAGVYYCEVAAADVADADKALGVIKDNTVSVKETVTKGMLNALSDTTFPKLTVTGYAVQKAGMSSAADAWAVVE